MTTTVRCIELLKRPHEYIIAASDLVLWRGSVDAAWLVPTRPWAALAVVTGRRLPA